MASGERMTKAERERRIAALRKSGALVPAGSAPGGVPGGSWLFPPDIARKVQAMTITDTDALLQRHERFPDLFPSPIPAACSVVEGCPDPANVGRACWRHYRDPEAPVHPERAKPGEGRQRTVRVTLNFTQEQGERLARAALSLGETKPGKLAARWVLERLKGESHG